LPLAKKEPLVLGGTDPKNEWFFLFLAAAYITKQKAVEKK